MILKPYETECYESYINRILLSRPNIKINGLTQKHHIIPKCVGGTNNSSNLIYLYHQEHYEAHRLLALENPDNHKLQYAWFLMCHSKDKTGYKVDVNSEDYAEAMKRVSELSKQLLLNNPIYKTGKDSSTAQAVRCIETQQIFDTCKDAAIYAGLNGKRGGCKISENCNGKRLSAGKHPITKEALHWEWVNGHGLILSTQRTNYDIRKVVCVETQEIFDNANIAGLWAGLGGKTPGKTILQCCNGKRATAGKHPDTQCKLHWEYADKELKGKFKKYKLKNPKEKSMKIAQSNKNRALKVVCIETGRVFNSVNEAGLWAGYCGEYIRECCRGEREWSGYHPITGEKLHWKYKDK